ncbi:MULTISPECIES: SDR family oxidoreductase [Enterobacter]|uniref:SDR family oxidoreductase n=1 Tax=Enterobacter TaxID=547 RepID=UPI000FEC0B6D|nr:MULTISPECIES: SDR family oxidoreductase [Enterobacter]HEO9146390.1 SDR family oxidoreductase [Enterobacter asburiae]MBM1020107.1 SDR family oxidoreductase [Enterobacter sp. E1]MCR1302747.1 SDR family oxidoreductase [Enterobacter sp. FL1277]MCR1307647.1 SDR family oxidoreductase [Enterobacter sp. BT1271]MCR1313049.1 SDR family oxidoreductase [Enterobacter sp. BT855]
MGRLAGKYTLITGGTSGIGLATAQEFIAEGAHVAVTGRHPETLAEAQRILGDKAWVLPSDAGDIAAQKALTETLASRWPRLDAVFINAGDVTHGLLEEWQEDAWDRLMRINLKGPFFLIQALLPLLNNPSSVILCGSVSARIGLPTSSVYAASKAGLLSLARTLSAELLSRGIRVNGLSPGPVETPALNKLGLSAEAQKALQGDIANLVPLGRMGTPKELAKAALYLASDESSYTVGTELLVDGGTGNL